MNDFQSVHEENRVTPEVGIRLDRALANALPDLSRNRIKSLILDGLVSTAGATILDPSYTVKPSDVFDIRIPQPVPSALAGEAIPLNIVFEDPSLIVIAKPAGLIVHPGAGRPSGTLVNALIRHCGKSLSGIGGVKRPGIVHRRDKDTSGLMGVAKTNRAHSSLAAQFEAHSVDRAYRAIVWGVPTPRLGKITGNIGRNRRNRTKMSVTVEERGKWALPCYRTLAALDDAVSLVECHLATGRTHQIRVHKTHIGHPLIGDPVYGRATRNRRGSLSPEARKIIGNFERQALHAAELGFKHPDSGERLHFTDPLPADMQLLKNALNLKYSKNN